MKYSLLLGLLILCNLSIAQSLTGIQLLERAINYHDPQGQWNEFSGTFEIGLNMPEKPNRKSIVSIDLPKSIFNLEFESGDNRTSYKLQNEKCKIIWNEKTEFTDEEKSKNKLTCERAKMMKDYYTYLYGLPMKLKDEGTIVHEKVAQKEFKGKMYNVLKITYEEAVGNDIWYFYFDVSTNAMEVYQFYHDEAINDGEYILLDGLMSYREMLFPKNRTWYYNKDNKLLGEDKLISIKAIN